MTGLTTVSANMPRAYKVDDDYVVADGSGWLPGVYPSEEIALLAAKLPDDVLRNWWYRLFPDAGG